MNCFSVTIEPLNIHTGEISRLIVIEPKTEMTHDIETNQFV